MQTVWHLSTQLLADHKRQASPTAPGPAKAGGPDEGGTGIDSPLPSVVALPDLFALFLAFALSFFFLFSFALLLF